MHPLEPAWETLKRDFEAASSQSARAARHQVAHELNQIVRRLRGYQTEAEWISAVLDGAATFAHEAAVFTVKDGMLSLRGQSGLELDPHLSFDSKSAGAFANAIESRDPVVALRTPGEVGLALSSADPNARAHIFPVMNEIRVAALVFAADDNYLDINALELIGGIASAVLGRQSNAGLHAQIAPMAPPRRKEPLSPAALPSWAELSDEQRSLHIRAQRFSRVAVAEMQIARPEICRAGRDQNNFYVFLKTEIDKARETYRKQFMTVPSMVDYLHLELVHVAAEGDELKLGADYPGQLV